MSLHLSPGWTQIAVAAGAAFVVALAGGLLTEIGVWYRNLRKPSWQPPDWLFGPVWTTIFTLAAWSGVASWRHAPDEASRVILLSLFAVNSLLNIAWSVLFFKLRRPDWALLEVILLWLSIAALIAAPAAYSPLSSWLLVPYLIWVSFAAYLNRTIVRLNHPFAAA